MRIIGGAWRGRILAGPAGATRPAAGYVRQARAAGATRPTADRVRQTGPADATRPTADRVRQAGPEGATRPTADRVRQALFDMLLHASWGGRNSVEDAEVLDVFAGTGALGLEALSRGAAHACFIEQDRAALTVLRANIAACRAADRSVVVAADALTVGGGPTAGLVFLDPPYGHDLVPRAMAQLRAVGRIAPNALVVAETGRDEPPLPVPLLDERSHGAARLSIWREP